ncbi:MAG: hypothetical protein ABI325_08640 [Ginsengibacter sp.]
MDIASFKESLTANKPPDDASIYLKALWHDAKGDWNTAHNLIQDAEDNNASWIHAYLHRKEGDISNAGYWYRRAGKKMPEISLEKEWENIADDLLNHD